MASYDQLPALVDSIVAKAIAADMSFRGYSGNIYTGFDGSTVSGDPVHITPPSQYGSGGGEAYDVLNGSKVFPGGRGYYPDQFDARHDVYDYWTSTIPTMFSDWFSLPDPASFSGPLEAAREAVHLLTSTAQVDPSDDRGGNILANKAIRIVQTIKGEVSPFGGPTMDNFAKNYSDQLPDVVQGQWGMANALAIMLAGEQRLWVRTRQDVADLAEAVGAAMDHAMVDSGGGSAHSLLTLVGSIAAVGALIPGVGEAELATLGAVGTVSGVLDTYLPADKDTTPVEYGADNPWDVATNCANGLKEMSDKIKTEETKTQDACTKLMSLLDADDGSFRLGTPRGLLGAHRDGQYLDPGELRTNVSTMHTIGHDYMPQLATQLEDAGHQLAAADAPGSWTRPGGIGLGDTGPHSSWAQVNSKLGWTLNDTGWQVRAAGQNLEVAANDFGRTENDITDGLDRLRRKLGSEPVDPTVPPPPLRLPGGKVIPQ